MTKANVVIDVEMCVVQKGYKRRDFPYEHEIIQIGAVMMDESYEMMGDFTTYVHPQYGKIDHFIHSLTGISEKDIQQAPPLEGALRNMLGWIAGRDVTFYSWSVTDYKQISREIRAKEMNEEEMSMFLDQTHWIDYQPVAGQRFDKRWRLALEDALMLAEVDPEGKQHDGLVDARNTARLIAKMEKNPESHFLQDRLQQNAEEQESLGTSLGNLLQDIKLP